MSLPKILVFSITLNSFCHPLCVIYVLFRDRSFFMGRGGMAVVSGGGNQKFSSLKGGHPKS